MIVKVCGMTRPENVRQVANAGADWIGFIFHPSSSRYVEQAGIEAAHAAVKAARDAAEAVRPICSVCVFVNLTAHEMISKATEYGLDYLQLHGHESPGRCATLQKRGMVVIKALPIATEKDLRRAAGYEGCVDYLLFDTKSPSYGGSGKSFNWNILYDYYGDTPFLLSGGLNPQSLEALQKFRHPRWAGVDLNSGFELEAGIKNPVKLKQFITQLRKNE